MLLKKKSFNRTICFLLPDRLDKPVGGHKIIYQYANFLSKKGFHVVIANNIFRYSAEGRIIELFRKIYSFIRFLLRVITNRQSCRGWFSLENSVEEKSVWSYEQRYIPWADYYIATNAMTAPYVDSYEIDTSNKVYFIQGYEDWLVGEKKLIESYRFPMKKIVVSSWLKSILIGMGEECQCVPNGYDANEFYCFTPIRKRNKYIISILYHEMPCKNFNMGIEAVSNLRKKYPNIRLLVFGVYQRPRNLPNWCEYYMKPSQSIHNWINNTASIYLGTSSNEGYGLTVLEAMACGQAVVCTDNMGYREVAKDYETALLSPVNDTHLFELKILEMIQNDNLRWALAERALLTANSRSLQNSSELFASLFK